MMDFFNMLKDAFNDLETRTAQENGAAAFELVNPYWEAPIRIVPENEEYIFLFAYQHVHYEDADDLIDYIREYVDGKRASIEFFCGDTDLFGGDRYLDDIDVSSGESLLKSFMGGNMSLYKYIRKNIKNRDCCCKIRAWNDAHNQDIEFRIG